MSRWQRERRQQAIIIVGFTTVLLVAVGLLGWSAANTYYQANLKPAAVVGGITVPWREWVRERQYQLVKFYQDNRVPPEFENDQQLAASKVPFDRTALDAVIEAALLRGEARAAGIAPTEAEVEARYAQDFGQYRTRHVLITPDAAATDKDATDKAALAKAQDVVKQLRAAPRDDELWKKVAAESSGDPGSKDQGGELGWVSNGQFVKEFETAAKALKLFEISEPTKSSFGYHVIQLEEMRGPEFNDVIGRWKTAGFTDDDIREHERVAAVREAFRARAEAQGASSPTAQVRLAKILVNTPQPSGSDFQSFSDALKKLNTVTTELAKPGADFAALAKQYSDDSATADQGGEVGWIARGTLIDLRAEQDLFALDAGKITEPYTTSASTTFYKVLEKDPARALTDEQRVTIKAQAYAYWLAKTRQERGVQRLVPGHEFD